MAAPTDPWRAFELDPRDPAHVSLRAADRDRDVVSGWLTSAYADGRLDRDELEERVETLARTKTLGELTPLVADLLPSRPPSPLGSSGPGGLARATPSDLERLAVESYRADLRARAATFVGLTLITWAAWFAGGHDGGPWPLIVMAVFGFRVARAMAHRRDRIASEIRRLEKRQRRALKAPETPMGDF